MAPYAARPCRRPGGSGDRAVRAARRAPAATADEILAAASRLFGDHGVDGTTMAQIAAGAGLQQSSLYYYFRSKEEILAAIVAKANVVPLELVRRVRVTSHRRRPSGCGASCRATSSPCAHCRSTSTRCTASPRGTGSASPAYWRERRTLQSALAAIVREGIADGSLRAVEPRVRGHHADVQRRGGAELVPPRHPADAGPGADRRGDRPISRSAACWPAR